MSEKPTSAPRLVLLGEEDVWAPLPTTETLVIGSSPERAGFVVPGQGVDPVHCAVGRVKGGGWAIKDLGSQYGTLVNGRPVTSTRLWTGDLIVLGSRRLRVVDPELPLADEKPAEAPLEEIALPPPAERPHLGGFRLDKLLGRGGMGSVHLALQESLHRPVALKVLSPRLAADRDFVRRFQTEARAAAALSHPNVVVVHDVGEADGHHFLAMEYMPGGTLEDRVSSSGPLPWRQVLDVLHDAAAGLVYAEEAGIVHRDIKPANLMLTGTGTVKIADLGLATHVEAEATQSEGKKIFGTPHFISPEQARGEAVDHRSDLYSLGATAYRLLTGHTPFEGETTRDILRGHFTRAPAPLAEHVPGIPAGLEDLVARLLAKDPADRPASAAVLLGEVDRLRQEADGEVLPPLVASRRRFPRGAAVTLVVLGVGATAAWKLWPRGSKPEAAPPPGLEEPDAAFPPPEDPAFFAGTEETGGGEDEKQLEILDLQAQLAYSKIPADLAVSDRLERLHSVAAEFQGTATALAVSEEILALEARQARAELEAERLRTALAACDAELRTAAGWPPPAGALPHPARSLQGLLEHQPSADLATSPEYAARRSALVEEIATRSAGLLRSQLDRASDLAERGEFDALRALLASLAARLDLAKVDPGAALPALEPLRRLGREVSDWQARIDDLARVWSAARAAGDRRLLADHLGRAGKLAGLLRALSLADALADLGELEARLATSAARERVEALASELTRARDAFGLLAREFASPGWRRRGVLDPRGTRPVTRDATGAGDEGILLDVGGEAELVPWSAFGGSVEAIEMLFKARLARDYTAEEHAGILVLLRLGATLQAASLADQVLQPDGRSILMPSEAAEMTAGFDRALAWAGSAPRTADPVLAEEIARLRTARGASVVLARGLLAAQEGSWTAAVGEFETLFSEYETTLLVTLLSDGSGWEEEAVPPPPDEPAPPPDDG